jgi:hypothetical protein
MAALLALAVGGEQAWYYGQWRAEQRSLDTVRALCRSRTARS